MAYQQDTDNYNKGSKPRKDTSIRTIILSLLAIGLLLVFGLPFLVYKYKLKTEDKYNTTKVEQRIIDPIITETEERKDIDIETKPFVTAEQMSEFPGRHNGEPVPVYFTLPVVFRLK